MALILPFAKFIIHDNYLVIFYHHPVRLTLRSVYLFWTMIDRRERTPLYDRYEAVIRKLGLSLMTTHIPYRSKFNKELLPDNTGVGRSTLLAPARIFACEAQLEILAEEILTLLKIR